MKGGDPKMSQDVSGLISALQSDVSILFDLLRAPALIAIGFGAAIGIAGKILGWLRS